LSETSTLWLFGTLISLLTITIGAIAAALWAHVGHCKEVSAAVARMEARLERLAIDVGTHETGLRGAVHETANRVTEISMKLSLLEKRGGGRYEL
jgi:hypothetical protein